MLAGYDGGDSPVLAALFPLLIWDDSQQCCALLLGTALVPPHLKKSYLDINFKILTNVNVMASR